MVSTEVWHVEHHEDLLKLYGKVCVRWAAVDLLLLLVLDTALGNQSAARDLIFNSTGAGRARFDVFNRAIGASKFEQYEREKLLSISSRFAKLLTARNDIVHSPVVMSLSVQGSRIKPHLSRLSRKGEVRDLSLDDVIAHINAVGALQSELEDFSTDLALKYDSENQIAERVGSSETEL